MAKKASTSASKTRTKGAAKQKSASADPFSAAAKRAARKTAPAAPTPTGTLLRLPDDEPEAHEALRVFRKAKLQIKSAEGLAKANGNALADVVLTLFAKCWIESGERPEGPIAVINQDGDKLVYVAQDKTNGGALRDDEVAQLRELIPEIDTLVEREEEFAFDPDVLKEPGVLPKLKKALAAAKLTKSQQERLLVVTTVHRLKESLAPRLAELAGDETRLAAILKAIPRLFVRYLKV